MLKFSPFPGTRRYTHTLCATLTLLLTYPLCANAQSTPLPYSIAANEALPNSPGAVRTSTSTLLLETPAAAEDTRNTSPDISSTTDKYILPHQSAPSITAGDKVAMGFKDAFSPLAVVGWLTSAGYSQLIDGSPNYGTDRGAYGQRLGASALRASSEGILSDAVMAPIFHEDPRYYQLGRGHNIGHRLIYAATRAIITRTDSGHSSVNFALITGNLEGAILTNAYYPSRNRTVKDTAETFAGSIGGSALGFVVSEFLSDTLEFVHLKNSR